MKRRTAFFLVFCFVLGCLFDAKVAPRISHRVELAQLHDEFAAERADLDAMQRRCAAYDASNKVAEDELRLLSSNPNP